MGRGVYSEFLVIFLSRPVLQILTLFQTKVRYFPDYVYTVSWFPLRKNYTQFQTKIITIYTCFQS